MDAEKTAVGGHWLILGGALFWGTTGTAQAFAPAGSNPLVIGTLRLLVWASRRHCHGARA